MKDDYGRVLIKEYYKGITLDSDVIKLLRAVPFDGDKANEQQGIYTSDKSATRGRAQG